MLSPYFVQEGSKKSLSRTSYYVLLNNLLNNSKDINREIESVELKHQLEFHSIENLSTPTGLKILPGIRYDTKISDGYMVGYDFISMACSSLSCKLQI